MCPMRLSHWQDLPQKRTGRVGVVQEQVVGVGTGSEEEQDSVVREQAGKGMNLDRRLGEVT